ncbi:aminomethyl-transferring glycine dehydrogenase [Amphibiibacter pelophylacis]|uniref:Aminomethyl-transferring glycine dehydrogenase n=1 Tax=Amphibiibacter pelophylacis TaxID=1799477 RepID=A0ACC6P047_9BURK
MSPAANSLLAELEDAGAFAHRHLGPDAAEEARLLDAVGVPSRADLVARIVPGAIRRSQPMQLPAACSETAALDELRHIASHNQVMDSHIGMGYYGAHMPGVIQRNVLENPAWYTAYTPYQAEISQGRLEALLNFQTMVCDLTGMAIANASMLDEATAAAEAMTLALRVGKSKSTVFQVADDVLPQTLAVLHTRAAPLGITVSTFDADGAPPAEGFGLLLQYPGVNGAVRDLAPAIAAFRAQGGLVVVAADLLALALLKSPGEMGADIAVGSTQRFGLPMANGGPHAAYLACQDAHKRSMPGRLVGVSVDASGQPALRLALQTREQHIRREKATSNICTAQVLPAVLASLYACYHGPVGLTRIARRVAAYTAALADALAAAGLALRHTDFFDTLTLTVPDADAVHAAARAARINLRAIDATTVGLSLDETCTRERVDALLAVFRAAGAISSDALGIHWGTLTPQTRWPQALSRTTAPLQHPVFSQYHSETAMLRYLRRLSDKDLALDRSMIPLGSCTMKLNATSEMVPITWPEFAQIHPYAPADQRQGYAVLAEQLGEWLCQATGYAGVSLQPNAGSQGEYAGLLVIAAWHASRGDSQRTICLIPASAHGTNPASAQMAGMTVVVTRCDEQGNVDLADLEAKCQQYADRLACVMVTYPSTHGVFEHGITGLCDMVHRYGGRVYVDGANMNALVGLAAPGAFGGDVSHLNLHKTFCIPHGGGGPGVGPVAVVEDLVPFLPRDITDTPADSPRVGAVSAAPLGNAGVLPISWMYMRMMGADGLQAATETAILNANYVAARLAPHYPVLYNGQLPGVNGGGVAHECIIDVRPLKERSGISAEDIAKRLIDYGFHAPTLSFPVPGTLMIEPTESEDLAELDRFCAAMIAIRAEIEQVLAGAWPRDDNPLVHAPHTAQVLLGEWSRAYPREVAAYPLDSLRQTRYWPPVGRVDNVYGDRNLQCSCPPLSDYV